MWNILFANEYYSRKRVLLPNEYSTQTQTKLVLHVFPNSQTNSTPKRVALPNE